nr:uncharacterized protein LOC109425372 [Aedes albopictus]
MAGLDELDRCRLCSSQNNLSDVFGVENKDELFRMIYACTSIRISFERDFPCAVCSSCIRIVKQFYSYRQKCLDHDRNLKRLRGENVDEKDEGEEDSNTNVPLKNLKKQKQEQEGRDKKFYEEAKQLIQSFLATEVKEVERKALEKVNEMLKKRECNTEEVLLQMTVEPADDICEEVEYEVLNDSTAFCQPQQPQQSQDDCKMELESIYFETSDNEDDRVEANFAGFDERTCIKGGPGSAGLKKRKLPLEDGSAVNTQTKALEKQLSEAQKKIDTLTQLGYELELKRLRLESTAVGAGGGIVATRFTAEEDIPITVQELERLNERSSSDSVFVGMLITRLIDPNELVNMSVTGQQSHRFRKLKKPDGSPLYPPTERIDPRILDFVCNKVAERTAMRIGPDDIHTIRKNSEERTIKRFIAQKIGNLKKADIVKRSRAEGDTSWNETTTE